MRRKKYTGSNITMINGWKIAFGGLLIVALSFYYINMMRTFSITPDTLVTKPKLQHKKLTLNTPGCQIPYLDPMHPSVAHLIKSKKPLVCKYKLPPPVVPGENPKYPTVNFLPKNLYKYGADPECFYKKVYRVSEHKSVENPQKHVIAKKIVKVVEEFIKVECIANRHTVFTDYFPFIQKKEFVEKRCEKANPVPKPVERLSVLLIGIDSVSKLQFLRHMKKTLAYMQKYTTHVDLVGYNKIGKNTYPNVVGMLTGHVEAEVNDTSKVYANALPLIWNEFAESGYRTLFSEDIPSISIFNYARKGFNDQPTDYYLRPFSLAVEKSPVIKKGKRGCFNGRLETDVVLKWTGDLFDVFDKQPVFAMSFLTRLSHDYINELSLQDEPYMRFIKRLKENGHLERSFVFFFSDHGFRFGDLRSTYIGRMEGKLPFMYILVPSWFPTRYPKLYANLKTNSQRLTTVLDIYATLHDILHFSGQEAANTTDDRSISLIGGIISENRTCEDAAVVNQYCACSELQQVSPTSLPVLNSARRLVTTVNEITKSHRNSCAEFTLDSVKSATIQHVHLGEEKAENASANYQVTFQVRPSGAIFEGSVWHLADKDTFHPQKDIERLNLYGNQSICVNKAALKPFCYCNLAET